MAIEFKVCGDALTSAAAIETWRARAGRALSVGRWATLLGFGCATYFAWLAWSTAFRSIPFMEDSALGQGFYSVLLTYGAFGIGVGVPIVWLNLWQDITSRLEPIELSQAERALALSVQSVEVDAYRRAAVSTRKLTKGDLKAMEAFVIEQAIEQRLVSLREQQTAALQALHKV